MNPQSHLLRIPQEVRDDIYRLCLLTTEEEPLCAGAPGRSVTLALIYTCRQVYHEGIKILYGENIVTFGAPALKSGKLHHSLNIQALGTPLRYVQRWELFVEIPPTPSPWFEDEQDIRIAVFWPTSLPCERVRSEFLAALSWIRRESKASSLLLKIASFLPLQDYKKTWQSIGVALRFLFRCTHNHPKHSLLFLSSVALDTRMFYHYIGEFVHDARKHPLLLLTLR